MTLEDAWAFSSTDPPQAFLQIQYSTKFFRWNKGRKHPILDFGLERRPHMLVSMGAAERLSRSDCWEPVRPSWEDEHPLQSLARAADDGLQAEAP